MAENGKKEPNPSAQLRAWTIDMRGTVAQVMGVLQGLSENDALENLGEAWDKRRHVVESQKSRALKEVKTLKTTVQELTKNNETIQADFDDLQNHYATLETNQTSLVKVFDTILANLANQVSECKKEFERLKEDLSLSTTPVNNRKRKDSVVSDESSDDGDFKHQKIKKHLLPLLEGEPPKPTLSKTFAMTPELAAHHKKDMEGFDLMEIGNDVRKEINEYIEDYNVTENDQHESPNLAKVVDILRHHWHGQFARMVFRILVNSDDLIYQRIELIFDDFMALIIGEFTFNSIEILTIRSAEDEHVADTKRKCSPRLIECFKDYTKAKTEYAKRHDVDCNEKCGHAEGEIEIEFDPCREW